MSALDAFHSTWSDARSTFGEGTPQNGTEYDASTTLDRLAQNVGSASPGGSWSGDAATTYGSANTDHGKTIGEIAGLDRRLGAQVDRSAEVVATGRRNLDAVRDWVISASSNLPPGEAGETMKLQIAQKGLARIEEVVQNSNGELASIGDEIRSLGDQYGTLGGEGDGYDNPGVWTPRDLTPEPGTEGEFKDQRLEEILKKYQVEAVDKYTVDVPFYGEQSVTETEAKLLAQAGPLGAYDILQIRDQADAEARLRFPGDDQHDNNADAFRHAYANALMVQRFGPEFAAAYATAHEQIPGNYGAVEAMDLYNNERGRVIGQLSPGASHEELANQVEHAVRGGQMVVVSADGKGLSWSDQPAGDGSQSPPLPGGPPQTNPYPGY